MTTWNEFVHEHGPAAYRTAWRILGHAQDCEDVLQEAFMEAHKLFVANKIANPQAFFSRLVTFRALDELRRRKPRECVDPATLYDATPGPDELAMCREAERQLRAHVAQLPARQAAVFCLIHFEQLSPATVAEQLNISINAVGMALHKARSRLREFMLTLQPDHKS